jgi:glucose uptake protein GlcU
MGQDEDPQTVKSSKLYRADFVGAVALVGTILFGSLSLDSTAKGNEARQLIGLYIGFIVFAASFILVEHKYAKEPILPLGLISRRDVLTSYVIIGLQAAGQFGVSR